MTAPSLNRCGELLYGPAWQSPLARALDVNLRTVQRWAAGEYPPPASRWPELAALLRQRQAEIAAALRDMAQKKGVASRNRHNGETAT